MVLAPLVLLLLRTRLGAVRCSIIARRFDRCCCCHLAGVDCDAIRGRQTTRTAYGGRSNAGRMQ
jgi:hypothetical protein